MVVPNAEETSGPEWLEETEEEDKAEEIIHIFRILSAGQI